MKLQRIATTNLFCGYRLMNLLCGYRLMGAMFFDELM
jgi:hypothetical protein